MIEYYLLPSISCNLSATIIVPSSKSETNRFLILQHLFGNAFCIHNSSVANDSILLTKILKNIPTIIDVEDAGTCLRFLIPFLALKQHVNSDNSSVFTIKGSERLSLRPIKELVQALQNIGAEIAYVDKIGQLPITITSKNNRGGILKFSHLPSSQFISALLLVGAFLPDGICVQLPITELLSESYIQLTIYILQTIGIVVHTSYTASIISYTILPQKLIPAPSYTITGDWSGASYWYLLAALSHTAAIALPYLCYPSMQGDAAIVDLAATYWQVETEITEQGVILHKKNTTSQKEDSINTVIDAKNFPDIVPTLVVGFGLLGKKTTICNVKTLLVKECNRIEALQTELAKLNIHVHYDMLDDILYVDGSKLIIPTTPIYFCTYDDHRIAMSLAAVGLFSSQVYVDSVAVVNKSYPDFWNQLSTTAFPL